MSRLSLAAERSGVRHDPDPAETAIARLAQAPHTVYILQDAEEYAIYVGMTADLPRRLAEHRRRPYWPSVASVWTQAVPDRASARRVERDLIAVCAPPLNVQGQRWNQ